MLAIIHDISTTPQMEGLMMMVVLFHLGWQEGVSRGLVSR